MTMLHDTIFGNNTNVFGIAAKALLLTGKGPFPGPQLLSASPKMTFMAMVRQILPLQWQNGQEMMLGSSLWVTSGPKPSGFWQIFDSLGTQECPNQNHSHRTSRPRFLCTWAAFLQTGRTREGSLQRLVGSSI